jgi:hypothetical protein
METIFIVIGLLGTTGSLIAIGIGYLVHKSDEAERQWWEARRKDFPPED